MRACAPLRVQFRGTLTAGFATITAVFLVFGAVGYAAFGEDTRDLITENLPPGWSTAAVKGALCCALFFTFPVMMVPVYEILERTLDASPAFTAHVAPRQRCAPHALCALDVRRPMRQEQSVMRACHSQVSAGSGAKCVPACRWALFKAMRVAVVAAVGFIAVSVPGFSVFIAFVGCFCCASLAFIIPATCHLILFAGKLTAAQRCFDYFLILFGFTGMIFGIGQTVHGMVTGEGVHG
jgi:solute carrier family 36 (proton-coupled amino acid transporter)